MEKETQEIFLSIPKVGSNEIDKINVGDSVKVNIDNKERLWVEVTEISNSSPKGRIFKGKIDVNPYILDNLNFGDSINFENGSIIDILKN